jgi:hypothetical protein
MRLDERALVVDPERVRTKPPAIGPSAAPAGEVGSKQYRTRPPRQAGTSDMPSTDQLDLTTGELAFVDGQSHSACIQPVVGVTVLA